jgi:hypothetical protein
MYRWVNANANTHCLSVSSAKPYADTNRHSNADTNSDSHAMHRHDSLE